MALGAAQIFYQISPSFKQAADLFLFFIRNTDTSEMVRSQLATQVAAVLLITFSYALFVGSWYVFRIYHQYFPA
jgi:hypothetical protein